MSAEVKPKSQTLNLPGGDVADYDVQMFPITDSTSVSLHRCVSESYYKGFSSHAAAEVCRFNGEKTEEIRLMKVQLQLFET